MAILIALLLGIGLVASSAILRGWVLSLLWGWFFVPVLDLPPLSIPQAIGISIVVGVLAHQPDTLKDKYQDSSKVWIAAFVYPLTVLLIGWIVKGFM